MSVTDLLTVLLVGLGLVFFIAGTAGLLRFPDVLTRLHALTKADNLGLGLVSAGVWMQSPSLAAGIKLLLIWSVVILGSSTVCHLVARRGLRDGLAPWRRSP